MLMVECVLYMLETAGPDSTVERFQERHLSAGDLRKLTPGVDNIELDGLTM